MNGHTGVLPGFSSSEWGKDAVGKENAALMWGSARSGLETYNNVEDKTQTVRDSVGF